MTSSGINYDRLGLVYFGDIEVLRSPPVWWNILLKFPGRSGE